jgi:O-antigen/teichoic acid export membrane protein
MTKKRLHTAARIVRNSIALFLFAAMAKLSGLVIAIIVARYLGAEALGIYAVLIALTMILEIVAPLGQQDVLIRALARDPGSMLRQWIESSVMTVVVAALFGIVLAVGSRLYGVESGVQQSVDVVALSLPFGSMNFVTQGALQGLERLKYIGIATFVGRLVMLVVMIGLLLLGTGVVAAFIGRLLFHVVTLGIMMVAMFRLGHSTAATRDWQLSPRNLYSRGAAALPFAVQRVLGEASMRGSLLVLPFFLSMQSVGLFDAADRVRQTLATMVPIVMLAIMPAFARTFRDDPRRGATLANYSMKFLLIAVLPMSFLIAAAAPQIVHLLYASAYDASVPVLRIVIWSQVFLSVDMILKQTMIASDNENSMMRRSAAGLLAQILLTVILVNQFGIHGVALAIVLTSIFIMVLDARFVSRFVVQLDFFGTIAKPLLCAAAAGALALTLKALHPLLIVAVAGSFYLVALFALRTFSADELMLMRSIPGHLLKRRA